MNILIVNDSPVLTAVIKAIVETSDDLRVVAVATNGVEAVNLASRLLPDLVLMDIHMPKMSGVEATRRIVQGRPNTRVLITSATIRRNMKHIFDALQFGALDYVRSPSLSYAPGTVLSNRQLAIAGDDMLRKIETVLRIGDEKVVSNSKQYSAQQSAKPMAASTRAPSMISKKGGVLAIGCSTGGPTTVAILLSHLHRPFPVPIIICQHIDAEFTQGFASWLTEQTGLQVSIARNRTEPQAGQVYVAPGGDMNLELSVAGRLMLTEPKPEQIYLPNINQLFFSIAEHKAAQSCGVVLTGMGKDGAAGLAAIKANGGEGVVQDLQSAVVDSMPRAAQQALGRELGYPPAQIAIKVNEQLCGVER